MAEDRHLLVVITGKDHVRVTYGTERDCRMEREQWKGSAELYMEHAERCHIDVYTGEKRTNISKIGKAGKVGYARAMRPTYHDPPE